mgnify:CR=1 FL=1
MWSDPHPERVVDAPFGQLAGAALGENDGPGRLLPADEVLGPAAGVQRRVYQLGAGVGFAQLGGHARESR